MLSVTAPLPERRAKKYGKQLDSGDIPAKGGAVFIFRRKAPFVPLPDDGQGQSDIGQQEQADEEPGGAAAGSDHVFSGDKGGVQKGVIGNPEAVIVSGENQHRRGDSPESQGEQEPGGKLPAKELADEQGAEQAGLIFGQNSQPGQGAHFVEGKGVVAHEGRAQGKNAAGQ